MGTRKSTTGGQGRFSQIPSADIQRSSFDRSCGYKTTFDSGYLIPFFADEALPGDTMSLNVSTFARLATPLVPIMDNMWMDTHFFAVPVRLLWDNWLKFNGEQETPGDSTDFLVPEIQHPGGGITALSIFDYFGLPTSVGNIKHSALWLRAYNQIFNQWFRDENLVDPSPINKDDGPDAVADYQLLRRGKRHDYFSSCLPFPQKGESVELPLGGSAVVTMDNTPANDILAIKAVGADYPTFSGGGLSGERLRMDQSSSPFVHWSGPAVSSDENASWSYSGLKTDIGGKLGVADLSSATAATINSIREAFQIQRLFERDARGGSRYTEIVRSHFGVTSPDARLQRPEYLGGGSQQINITSVPQTSETDTNTPQGNLAAFGTSAGSTHGFNKSFTEHCVIIGLISVRADLNYQQGINRMWSRRTRFDFYWPVFASLGEQSVLNKEIYYQDDPADDLVFGYQERYAEYRYKPSLITGQMRSQHPTPLDIWHLAQDFADLPVLGETFIEENPPIDRIIAVQDEPQFLLDAYFTYKCARPMPAYSVPGMIDHF